MDHSIYGYLSRRSKEELAQIIAKYKHLEESKYYAEILVIAKYFLKMYNQK